MTRGNQLLEPGFPADKRVLETGPRIQQRQCIALLLVALLISIVVALCAGATGNTAFAKVEVAPVANIELHPDFTAIRLTGRDGPAISGAWKSR